MRKDIYFGSHTLSPGSLGLDARGPVVSPHSAVAGVQAQAELSASCQPGSREGSGRPGSSCQASHPEGATTFQ